MPVAPHRVALPAAALLLLLARGLGAQETIDPAFLGMTVADSITEDSNGLTLLSGVHHAVRSETLPVTEDLHIYSRWQGTGKHSISVTILDENTGETLASSTDELDFGAHPVTFTTNVFPHTRFPSDGTYAIEVAMDGKSEADYGFYVNADGQLPDSPQFVLSVPAVKGSIDDAGDATVSGIFESLRFADFPGTDSFSAVTLWFSGTGTHDHYTRITEAGGTTIATSAHSMLSAVYGTMSVANDAFHSIAFPAAGIYTATVYFDGNRVFSYPLVVEVGNYGRAP